MLTCRFRWRMAAAVVSCVTMISTAAQAATVITYNPRDPMPCQRLDDVESVEEAIAQLQLSLDSKLRILSAPMRFDAGNTAAVVELPDPRGPQSVMLLEVALAECEKGSRASKVGPGAIPGTGDSQPDWVRIASADGGRETVDIDASSIHPEPGGFIRLWIRQVYRDDQPWRGGRSYRSVVTGYALDCSAGGAALMAAELYDANRRRVDLKFVLRAQWQLEHAETDSLQAMLLAAHCRRVRS